MKSKTIFLACSTLSAVVGFLAQPSDVSAAFAIRRTAASCFAPSSATMSGGSLQNGGSTSIDIFCPTPEDSAVLATAIKKVNVHGYNSNYPVETWAEICAVNYGNSGVTCRNHRGSGNFQMDYQLELGTPNFASTWIASDDFNFKYVLVRLGTVSPAGASTLRGVFFSS